MSTTKSPVVDSIAARRPADRARDIVETLVEAFEPLIKADPAAFRSKFRKMAADPFAFYRGSACLFFSDVTDETVDEPDRWADERTSRVWIQGDLHCKNFGTYMDSSGVLVFDVNDYDEAYVGHFTWDVQRLAASLALLGFGKALSDDTIEAMIRELAGSYVDTVRRFAAHPADEEFRLTLDTTDGALRQVLLEARMRTRIDLLQRTTTIRAFDRSFREGPGVRTLDKSERDKVEQAFHDYLHTIPEGKRKDVSSYHVKDIVGRSGFGIGSAGLPAYNLLVEGNTQALENDVVLSMKQGNVAAASRVVNDPDIRGYFEHHGHRTVVSQRALQAHADPWLGWCEIDGVGQVVQELSPYEADIEWADINERDEIMPLLRYLGQAVAKVHCVSDADSEQSLVKFQTEDAICAAIGDADREFTDELVAFGLGYAELVRDDYRHFVDAFRNGRIPGVDGG
ncbi:MAG TPA: DUF2252 domain-containing protein [Cryptosporangiaceae bacterium]|nr:DUF2252 domain-containing protein [Cryptosporangiaceae bacterium]